MFDYSYAYLFANLFLCLPVWLLVFWRRKDLRHKILMASLVGGIAGPLSEIWYTKDYWQPLLFTGGRIGFEDFLFGFFVAGVASVLYEELLAKKFTKRHLRKQHWILLILPLIVVLLYTFNHLFPSLSINSIYASAVAFFIVAAAIIFIRPDLETDSLVSGILSCLAFFLGYLILLLFFPQIFNKMWYLKNISGITLFTIPIEELLWALSFGMFAGPIYEFYAGLTFKKK